MSLLKNITLDSFGLEARLEEDKATLRLSGTGDMLAVEPLKQCLKALQAELAYQHLSRLDVDIRSLYLMNSSCIKAFVSMIYALQTAERELTIEFVVDKNLSWQARAIAPLERMAPELVRVSSYPEAPVES
ncbi:MAG: hypothetical protein ACOY0T_00460 [Myxococcota bacterium]